MKLILSGLVAVVLAGPTLAQGVIVANRPFDEAEFPRAKVSGGLVVGAMLTTDSYRKAQPDLFARLPQQVRQNGEVCVRVTARDGTYEAINTYFIQPPQSEGPARFEYPTTLGNLLEEKAVVARMSEGDCEAEGTPVIPVIWNAPDGATWDGMVNFYVNTGGAEALIVVTDESGRDHAERCLPVEEVNGLKYTAVCQIDASLLSIDELTTVYLDVTRNRVVESYEFEVVFAGR